MIDLTVVRRFDFRSAEYRELLRASNATAFQHPDWLDPLYRLLAPAHGVEPHIVVGRDRASGRLQMILPLVHAGTSVEYAFLGVTDYACPVIRPEALGTGGDASARLLAAMNGGPVTIAPVRQEHVAEWRLLLGADPKPLAFSAHSMPVAMPDPNGRARHFSARRRKDLARKASRLGRLELEVVHGGAIGDIFVQAQEFRRGRFENDPLQLDHGLQFYTEVATRGDLSGLSRTLRLTHDGRTVAMLFGLIDSSRFRYIILACDYARYSDFSPGLLIFDRAIAHWVQAGGDVFDFTIGDEPYKSELGCTSTSMFAFAVG